MGSSEAKEVKDIIKEALIVSLDIGKGSHHAYFRAPDGTDIEPFAFTNGKRSFEGFWSKLSRFKEQHHLKEVVIGFESTGPYAEPLFHFLSTKAVKLVQVNPMHTKRVKELTGNSPHKSDKKDPRVIADVICLGHALTVVIPQGAAAHLRRLTQARERAMERRTALTNQLQHLVFVIFPEFLSVMKDVSTKSASHLMRHYPSPHSIVSLGVEGLTEVLRKVSRGKLGQERAEQLCAAAKCSVGITEGKESILLEIAHCVNGIERECRFIKGLEEQMCHHLEQIPYSHSILSIKGIGNVTAAGLIGEVGDFRRFTTIGEIMKLAGLNLYEISSGKHKGQRRISKRGRSLMRKLLFFAAINAVKSKGIMHEPYQQMLDRGMPKIKALIAIARKLLRVIFAVVRDNTVYVEDHNHMHTLKSAA